MTDDEFDTLQAEYDLCGVDGRLRDFAEAVQAAERGRCAALTAYAVDAALAGYYDSAQRLLHEIGFGPSKTPNVCIEPPRAATE